MRTVISGSVLYSDSVLDGENVSMMVIFFLGFLSDRVADDLLRCLSRERLRSDGQSLRRRGSSCGMCLSTGVRVRELERTAGLGEVVGELGGENLGDSDMEIVFLRCCCC